MLLCSLRALLASQIATYNFLHSVRAFCIKQKGLGTLGYLRPIKGPTSLMGGYEKRVQNVRSFRYENCTNNFCFMDLCCLRSAATTSAPAQLPLITKPGRRHFSVVQRSELTLEQP